MYREEYYPQFVDSLGPIVWTPCDVANPTELSQIIWIFDQSRDKVRPASKRETSDAILLGLNGSTPGPFTISWKEVSDDIDARFLSEFTTTVTPPRSRSPTSSGPSTPPTSPARRCRPPG